MAPAPNVKRNIKTETYKILISLKNSGNEVFTVGIAEKKGDMKIERKGRGRPKRDTH